MGVVSTYLTERFGDREAEQVPGGGGDHTDVPALQLHAERIARAIIVFAQELEAEVAIEAHGSLVGGGHAEDHAWHAVRAQSCEERLHKHASTTLSAELIGDIDVQVRGVFVCDACIEVEFYRDLPFVLAAEFLDHFEVWLEVASPHVGVLCRERITLGDTRLVHQYVCDPTLQIGVAVHEQGEATVRLVGSCQLTRLGDAHGAHLIEVVGRVGDDA